MDGKIHAITLASRTTEWTWPNQSTLSLSGLGETGVWVQEHQLNIGQNQLFVAQTMPRDSAVVASS